MNITTVGFDLAKNVLHVVCFNSAESSHLVAGGHFYSWCAFAQFSYVRYRFKVYGTPRIFLLKDSIN